MQEKKKILNRTEIKEVVCLLRQSSKTIVFTNGCFDILHVGHLDLLENAKSQGNILIVGLNSDASIKRLKGRKRPINSGTDRARLLGALEVVDYVVFFEEDTPYEIIREIQPDILVKGGDYHLDNIVGRDIVESLGGRVIVVPLSPVKSTTELLAKIMKEF